jgi:hypothetical protein
MPPSSERLAFAASRKGRRRTRRRQLTDCQAQHCGAKRHQFSCLLQQRVPKAIGAALEAGLGKCSKRCKAEKSAWPYALACS